MKNTDNINIHGFRTLTTPNELKKEFVLDERHSEVVWDGRETIRNIIKHRDNRMMMIVGPCSLHDRDAALEYAKRLKKLQDEVSEKVYLVMRAYFEKPRTTIGWKGMLYDPHLDGSGDIQEGLRRCRELLLDITDIGLSTATEVLDPIVPQYLTDLIGWVSIGARTSESQIHRQMASGLSMPIGFKNATDGSLETAVQAIKAAKNPHSFFGMDGDGRVAIADTKGNDYSHFVLRGGKEGPNYTSEYIAFAEALLKRFGMSNGIVVDCSHANSFKDHTRQREVVADIIKQKKEGNSSVVGMMLESFLDAGSQSITKDGAGLKYGVSITDECIGWTETEELIRLVADSI